LAFAAGVLIWVSIAGIHLESMHSFELGIIKQYAHEEHHEEHDDAHDGMNVTSLLFTTTAVVDGNAEEHHEEEVPQAWAWAPRLYAMLSAAMGLCFMFGVDYMLHHMGLHHHAHGHDHDDDHRAGKSSGSGAMDSTPDIRAVKSTSADGYVVPVTPSQGDTADTAAPMKAASQSAMKPIEVELAGEIVEIEDIMHRSRELTEREKHEIKRASLWTMIAVTIHNFPEGLATFVSTVAEPRLGLLVGFAVALHNLPLGVSVGLPVYFATGDWLHAVGWAAICGLSALVGAVAGVIIVVANGGLHNYTAGVMFGFVVGVMLYTAFKELIPQARALDPKDRYSTWLIFAGFLFMDIGLLVFDTTGGHDH
jgi:zinc transporter ZupT